MRSVPSASTYIAVDHEAWAIPWLRKSIKATGRKFLLTECPINDGLLDVITEDRLELIILALPAQWGTSLFEHINDRVEKARKILPSAIIVFASVTGSTINEKTLPPFVYIVTNGSCDIQSIIHATRWYRVEKNWELRNTPQNKQPVSLVLKKKDDPFRAENLTCGYCVANINIKHISMLVPCALASSLTGKVVSCEISPQEVAHYHLNFVSPEGMERSVRGVFQNLKATVDELNNSMGSKLLLHLDHCDDIDIFNSACEVGFDSVMADGSAKTLEQNIRFTQRARLLALDHGIPTEGEVGYIDESGLRKWGKTTIDDFLRFVDATKVDYVGVNIGQCHGFDYGFSATRENLAEMLCIEKQTQGEDCSSFIEACRSIDESLRLQNYGDTCVERRLISKIANQVLSAKDIPAGHIGSVLNNAAFHVALYQKPLIDMLEAKWLSLRLKRVEQKQKIWREMFDGESFKKNKLVEKAVSVIDHALLRILSVLSEQRETRLVIHGGSSLNRKDLEKISECNVARVNFGSDIFAAYLTALEAEMPERNLCIKDATHSRKMSFLGETTRDWRLWKNDVPSCVRAFAERLAYNYVLPLSRDTKDCFAPLGAEGIGASTSSSLCC